MQPDYDAHAIRRIVVSSGIVTTLAGHGVPGYANGYGTLATFNNPHGIAIDATGSIALVVSMKYRRELEMSVRVPVDDCMGCFLSLCA